MGIVFAGALAFAPLAESAEFDFAPPAPEEAQVSRAGNADSTRTILETIGSLEAEQDAKCNSTASRFEDFLFGTPLSAAARQEKTRLQKVLVRRLWFAASEKARAAGERQISAERIRDESRQTLLASEVEGGILELRFPDFPVFEISARRGEQYGSIAFSLRAILGVQQELLLSTGQLPLPLTPEATEALRITLDRVALAAQLSADESARLASEFEIDSATIRVAWELLVGAQEPSESLESFGEGFRPNPLESSLLGDLIDQKTAAYQTYNKLSGRKRRALFVTNTVRFYARAKIARDAQARGDIIAAVNLGLDEFSQELLTLAQGIAEEEKHLLVRADDAHEAARRLLPQKIDVFEDVHVFPNLPEDERVTLEAYDCDSFRDFGIHWLSLKRVFALQAEGAMSVDPFAAEIIAEAISQYGVLLLRIAGENVNGSGQDLFLKPKDLAQSAREIAGRSGRHPDMTPVRPESAPIASAAVIVSPTDSEALYFTDITDEVGLSFQHRSSKWLGEFRHKQVKTPPTFSGGGVAAEDIDGDGHTDLLFVGGAGNALLINQGDGRFIDLTDQAGLDYLREDGSPAEARNPIVADFDNDGLQDILITYVDDEHRLYRNLGNRKFSDSTALAGLGGKGGVGGPVATFDYDGDGLLDLYIGYFGDYLNGDFPAQERDNHQALPNRLLRNLGGMRFEDVTEASGTGDRGWAQAVSHLDFDGDGKQDIIVANDYGLNAVFRNKGGGQFENVAPDLNMRRALHSMNVGTTDINRDGYPDIYISNIATLVKDNKYTFPDVNTALDFDPHAMAGMLVKEADTFFVSRTREGEFSGYEISRDIERGATSTGWAWDAEFFDFDHDGDDDLYLVNGINDYNAFSMIYGGGGDEGQGKSVLLSHGRESNVFFLNEGARLKNRSAVSGADFTGNSRSTAYLDFDQDGDLDIAINNFHSGATLLRNNTREGGEVSGKRWLKIRLEGDPEKGSNRDAIGARIEVRGEGRGAEGIGNSRIVQGGSGYLSMNPKEQHFGMADAQYANIWVTWPNGEKAEFQRVVTNRAHRISQAEGINPKALSGPGQGLPPGGSD